MLKILFVDNYTFFVLICFVSVLTTFILPQSSPISGNFSLCICIYLFLHLLSSAVLIILLAAEKGPALTLLTPATVKV